MFNQDDGGSELIVHIQHEAAHVLLFFDIHACHGLVKQQHLGLHGQRTTKVHPLLQAVGQLTHGGLAKGLNFQKVDDVLDKLAVLLFFALGRANAQGLQEHVALDAQVATRHDVVDHAHALEQGQVLEGARHAHLGHLARIHVLEGVASESDAALLRLVDPVDAVKHGAFASPVGADDRADLVFLHVKGNVGQCFDATKTQ